MNSKFKKLHDLLLNCSNSINIISVTGHGRQIRTLRIIQISIYETLILYIKKEKLAKMGGILIYLKNDIKFKIIKTFLFLMTIISVLLLKKETRNPRTKSVYFGLFSFWKYLVLYNGFFCLFVCLFVYYKKTNKYYYEHY